jgi:hypothetical protein
VVVGVKLVYARGVCVGIQRPGSDYRALRTLPMNPHVGLTGGVAGAEVLFRLPALTVARVQPKSTLWCASQELPLSAWFLFLELQLHACRSGVNKQNKLGPSVEHLKKEISP